MAEHTATITSEGDWLYRGDVLDAYATWPTPTTIVSDGGYGIGGFPGDPRSPDGLPEWYAPHIAAWSHHAHPSTSLWFWNTEHGWANVHPLLVLNGWQYEFACIWDKGIGHIAGNTNGKTLRRFPVVTEICVFYSRALRFPTPDVGELAVKEWMRHEWTRAGIPLSKSNEACGVANAATRKYLTQDHLWYFPPPEMMEKLVAYANKHGHAKGQPYYSLDGKKPVTAEEWASFRYRWNNGWHGITNVWNLGPLHGAERIRASGSAVAHLNQKPLELMERTIQASTNPGDVVWEPFGGLCSASIAATRLGRRPYAAEHVETFADIAVKRMKEASTPTRRVTV